MKTTIDYWFIIEPYVYISIVNNYALLYNTLDGVILESDNNEAVALLQEILQEDNCGVVLLKGERYKQKGINSLIRDLQEKYMGDIIDTTLSKGKPIQILPYINISNKRKKRYNFDILENALSILSEITIHIDYTSDINKLMIFIKSIPDNISFNIISNTEEVKSRNELLSFLNQKSSKKNILCSYKNITLLSSSFGNNFSYKVSIHFPIDKGQWKKSIQLLQNQTLPFEYHFNITSLEDYQEAQLLAKQYQIEKYEFTPIYTGNNIVFFEENIFLVKEDILSVHMSIKDFFVKQNMNIHDFGKINIMPDGDMYANLNHPVLGNIYTHSILEIIQKELKDGRSWLRIRNQAPCNACLYQWLCPSPSNYEIVIGRPNLCHVKQQKTD